MATRLKARVVLTGVLAASLFATPARAATLKKQTVEAFNRYTRVTQRHMAQELRDGQFLVIDSLPEPQRKEDYEQLQDGMLHIQHMQTYEDGKPIPIPDGLVHDWAGVAFIPGVTLAETLAVLQNYSAYQKVYSPTIQRSRLLSRDGNTFMVYMRYYREAIVTVTFDADFDIRYTLLGDNRALIDARSTRIAEVADVGQPDEHDLPVGNDHGYVWRFDNYWRIEQKDGGVYVQVEAIALSRNIPFIFRWLIMPLVESIPRKLLAETLTATRNSVEAAAKASAAGEPLVPRIPGQPARPARHLTVRWNHCRRRSGRYFHRIPSSSFFPGAGVSA